MYQEDVNGMIGYFVLFKRALHAASRPEVLENLRPTLKVFMEALDVKMVFGFTEVSVFFLLWWLETFNMVDFLAGRASCDIGLYGTRREAQRQCV